MILIQKKREKKVKNVLFKNITPFIMLCCVSIVILWFLYVFYWYSEMRSFLTLWKCLKFLLPTWCFLLEKRQFMLMGDVKKGSSWTCKGSLGFFTLFSFELWGASRPPPCKVIWMFFSLVISFSFILFFGYIFYKVSHW